MKIRPMRAKLFHADRQTDMRTLIVAFHNFANTPNKPSHIIHSHLTSPILIEYSYSKRHGQMEFSFSIN